MWTSGPILIEMHFHRAALMLLIVTPLAVPRTVAAQTPTYRAQFAAAEAKLAALKKTFKKLGGTHKLEALREVKKDAEGAARALSEIYQVIYKAAKPNPIGNDALCRAGFPIGLLASNLYSAITDGPVPKAVVRLGSNAVSIYHEQVMLLAQQQILPLLKEAGRHLTKCQKVAGKGKYRQEAASLMKNLTKLHVAFVAAQAGAKAKRGASSSALLRTSKKMGSGWWYTRCRPLDVVTKGYIPAAAVCRTLVLSEVARLTRYGAHMAKSKRWEASVRAYSRAIKMLPDYEPARRARAFANAKAGRMGACLEDMRWWRKQYKGGPNETALDDELNAMLELHKRRRKK